MHRPAASSPCADALHVRCRVLCRVRRGLRSLPGVCFVARRVFCCPACILLHGVYFVARRVFCCPACILLPGMYLHSALVQTHLLFRDPETLHMFKQAYGTVLTDLKRGPWYRRPPTPAPNPRPPPLPLYSCLSSTRARVRRSVYCGRACRGVPWRGVAGRYIEANMYTAQMVWPLYNSLSSFWPGFQARTRFTASLSHWQSYAALCAHVARRAS